MPPPIGLDTSGVVERRRWPRFPVRGLNLAVGVAVVGGGTTRTFTGRAIDLSEGGLAIALPPGEDCGDLGEVGQPLAAVVTLPGGTVRLRAATAHCRAPDATRPGGGYLIGVRITEMSAEDHRLLAEFLRALT